MGSWLAFGQVMPPAGWSAVSRGADTVLRPDAAPAGSFTLTMHPAQSRRGATLETWFDGQSRADAAQRGKVVDSAPAQRAVNGKLSSVYTVVDAHGVRTTLIYAGIPDGGEGACLATIATTLPSQQSRPFVSAGGRYLSGWSCLGGAAGGGGNVAAPPAHSAPTRTDEPAPRFTGDVYAPTINGDWQTDRIAALCRGNGKFERRMDAERATAGGGIPAGSIAGVIAGGRMHDEWAGVLMKDGTAFFPLDVPPQDLNVEAAHRDFPNRWYQWRRQGDILQVQANGGRWVRLDARAVRPLEQGGIPPQLTYAHGFGNGIGGVYHTEKFTTNSDGHFAFGVDSISGVGTTAGGSYSGSVSSIDRNGQTSAAMGGSRTGGAKAGGSAVGQTRGDNGEMYGTYRIDGYAMELHFASGRTERVLAFHRYADDPKWIYIASGSFSPPR